MFTKSKTFTSLFVYFLVFVFSFFYEYYSYVTYSMILPYELNINFIKSLQIIVYGFIFNSIFLLVFVKKLHFDFKIFIINFINFTFLVLSMSFLSGCMLVSISKIFVINNPFLILLPPALLCHIFAFYYRFADSLNFVLKPFFFSFEYRFKDSIKEYNIV